MQVFGPNLEIPYVVAGSSDRKMFKHFQNTVIDVLLKRAFSQDSRNLSHNKNIF